MMIALGKGVCSDEKVSINQPYLARIDERYFVIKPIDNLGACRDLIPWREACYIDPMDKVMRSFDKIHELAPIF